MAENRKDIELRIAATTTGSDAIRKIGEDLEAVGNKGSESGKKAQELNTALAAIGKQGEAVATLDKIEQTVGDTSAKFDAATQRVKELGIALASQQSVTEGFRQRQADAAAALKATAATLADQRAALNTLSAEYDRAGKATVGYKEKVEPLRKEIAALENTLAGQKAAFKEAKDAAAGAGSELGTLEGQYKKAGAAVATLERAITKQTAELTGAKVALSTLGVEASDAAAALVKVEKALDANAKAAVEVIAANTRLVAIEQTVAAANERNAALARKAAADRVTAANRAAQAVTEQAAAEAKLGYRIQESTDRMIAQKAAALAAGDALQSAFSIAGVRSVNAIEAEIRQLNAAIKKLAGDTTISGAEFDRAFTAARSKVAALEREMQGLPPLLEKSAGLAGVLRQSFSQLTAAFGAFELGRQFITANNQIETLRRSLTVITGTTEGAASQIDFLRKTAGAAGLSVGALTQDFINFSAAASTSGISLERQREIFTAVTKAAATFGITTDRVGLILQALAQTASKGKVTLEELQGQLGESLPGALALVADGFGVTKDRLLEMVKAGIDSNAFFDAFVRGSRNVTGATGEVVSFQAAVNRLGNEFKRVAQEMSDSAFWRGLTRLIDGAASNLDTLASTAKSLIGVFIAFKGIQMAREFLGLAAAADVATGALGRNAVAGALAGNAATASAVAGVAAVGAASAAVGKLADAGVTTTTALQRGVASVGLAATNAASQIGQIGARLAAVGGNIAAVFGGPVGVALTLAVAFFDQIQSGFVALFAKITGVDKELAAVAERNKKREAEQKVIEDAANARATARAAAVKLVVDAYDAQIGKTKAFAAETELASAASQKAADISARVAALAGDEVTAKEALASAAEREIAFRTAIRKAIVEQIGEGERAIAGIVKEAGGRENLNEAQRAQIIEINKTTSAKRDELAIAEESLKVSKVEAAERRNAAEEIKGQTKSIEGLKAAADGAAEAFDKARRAQAAGLVVGRDLFDLQIKSAAAQGAYKKALDESLAAVGANAQELRSGLSPAMLKAQGSTDDLKQALKAMGATASDTSVLLSKSFAKEIELAGTERALEGVTRRLLEAKKTGEVFGLSFENEMNRVFTKATEFANSPEALRKVQDQIKEIIRLNPEMAGAFSKSVDAVKAKLTELTPALRQARDDAALLGIALSGIGGQAAKGGEEGIRAYERLKASGKATAGELQQAFIALGIAAVAAAGGIIPEWVKVEASIRGVTIEVDSMGKAVATVTRSTREELFKIVAGFNAVSQATKDAENAALRYGSVLKQSVYDAQKFLLDASGSRFSAAVGDGNTFSPSASGSQIEQLKATRDAALTKQQRLQFNQMNNRAFNGAQILTTGVSPGFVQSQRDTVAAASQQAFAELQAAEDALRAAEASLKEAKANASLDQIINGQSSGVALAADKAAGRVPIVINLNGTSRNLTVGSENEANVLIGLLQQIGAAASRAGG